MVTEQPDSLATKPNEVYDAWKEADHADHFDFWNRFSTAKLLRICSQFNEFKLFRSIAENESRHSLLDVGCAAGGFYRYFRNVSPSCEYAGFDISAPAISHARRLYPQGDFQLFDGNLGTLSGRDADIVFSRDVVLHQRDPVGFLSDLYGLAGKYLLLRLRTRQVGKTVYDPELSCQYMYGHWVPYIVFNEAELLDVFRSLSPLPSRVTILRHHVVLGGHLARYLPKPLYQPDAGTAETAVLVEVGDRGSDHDMVVNSEVSPESLEPSWKKNLAMRVARYIGV